MTYLPENEEKVNVRTRSGTSKKRGDFMLYDLVFRQTARGYIDMVWMSSLTATEYTLVVFLFSRTLYWDKVWEVVPGEHFTDGVAGQFAGTGLSKNTVTSGLSRLVDDGFVLRKRVGSTFAFALNLRAMGTAADPLVGRTGVQPSENAIALEFQVAKARGVARLTKKFRDTGKSKYLRAAEEISNAEGV